MLGASKKDYAVKRMNLATPFSSKIVSMRTGRLRWMGRDTVKSETRIIEISVC